ncbi:MarR family transcriptional regulator [Streptomyces laculatispora]|uniref:MarR family transcriptional regulator n=1 Tax=Streptomyces laculatispora TaxID=887464 RepID=UPI0035117993
MLSDLLGHPDTSGAIAVRTGLPQSQVSGDVARPKDAGSIVTEPDPAYARRQLIRRTPDVSEQVSEIRASRIDDALATALGTDDPERLREAAEALDVLARHLTPETVGRLRPWYGGGAGW